MFYRWMQQALTRLQLPQMLTLVACTPSCLPLVEYFFGRTEPYYNHTFCNNPISLHRSGAAQPNASQLHPHVIVRNVHTLLQTTAAHLVSGAKYDSGRRTSGPSAVTLLLLPLPLGAAVLVLLRNTFASSTAVAPVVLMSSSRSSTPRYVLRFSGRTAASAS
jgi:hypothetical protein